MIERRLIARDDELDRRLMLLETREGMFRERLTANRTYYVSTTGSNNNDGRSASTPWATLQFALDWVTSRLDFGQYQVTIQLADGTYTGQFVVPQFVAALGNITPALIINGNASTPGNVILQTTTASATTFTVRGISGWVGLQNLRIQANVSGSIGLISDYNSRVSITNVDFGICQYAQIYATLGGLVLVSGNYSISGGAAYHYFADSKGLIVCLSKTVTLSGTLTFTQFALSSNGVIRADGSTYTGGTITGQRYFAQFLGIIYGDGNANKFPGSTAGSPTPGTLSSSGGYYV